jgi:hypothetical protein
MRRIKPAEIGLFVLTITNGGAALATCPNTMPLESIGRLHRVRTRRVKLPDQRLINS